MIYNAYEAHADAMWPSRQLVTSALPALRQALAQSDERTRVRELAAACELFSLAALTHRRPPFGIASVRVGERDVKVQEESADVTPFATLLHFKKAMADPGPRVLIVAPMSGHFATLLRETVRTMLGDHDVYITDWHNARDVPFAAGCFGLDEYTTHVMEFLGVLGPGASLMAICQPCVVALSAVSIMSEDAHPATPSSLILVAGPIDCRISPTAVNKLATDKPVEWFAQNLIATVPLRYAGAMRRVYPGFLQLMAFLSMNLERHINAFCGLYEDLLNSKTDKVQAARAFYEEYFAVSDLPAEFYLETVQHVFQEHALPQGKLRWRGRVVNPRAIRATALLTVEGERDDICSLGQTLAAHDLCTGLKQYMRTHYVQPNVGHYGVFSGRRWNNHIYPIVRDVIQVSR